MPVTRVCETCGKPFSVKPYRSKDGRGKYCSDICKGKGLSGKNNPNYQGKSITDYQKQKRKEQIGTNAPGYGKHPSEETRQKMSLSQKGKPHILHSEETRKKIGDKKRGIPQCDETRRKISESKKGKPLSEETRRKMTGRKHTLESRKKMSLAKKGKPLSKDHVRKLSESRIGLTRSSETRQKMKISGILATNDIWYGGVKYPDPPKYCELWNENLRNRVRAFFGYQCVECGTPQNGRKLSAHHIHYDKKSCCKNGEEIGARTFIALCTPCHMKTNHNRPYWEQHFTDIINTYYEGKCYFTKDEMKAFQQGVTV